MKKKRMISIISALLFIILAVSGSGVVYAQNNTGITELTDPFYQVSISNISVEERTQLIVTPLDAKADVVKSFQKETPTGQSLIHLFDIKLMKDNREVVLSTEAQLSFPMEEQYEGKTLKVFYHGQDKVESVSGKVENQILTVKVKELSSFAVVVGTAAVSSGNSSGNASGTTKTGDEAQAVWYILLAVFSVLAGAYALRMGKKQILSMLLVISMVSGMLSSTNVWADEVTEPQGAQTDTPMVTSVQEDDKETENTSQTDVTEQKEEQETDLQQEETAQREEVQSNDETMQDDVPKQDETAKQELTQQEKTEISETPDSAPADTANGNIAMPESAAVSETEDTLKSSAQLKEEVQTALNKALSYQLSAVTNPTCNPIGGEWTVLGLARSGSITSAFTDTYLRNLYTYLEERDGVLHKQKYTEYSRVTIALSALGMDARYVNGYDVLSYLADYDKVIWQGINGPIFALIALDTRDYEVPKLPEGSTATQTTRENLIARILELQCADGGWTLKGSVADTDMTGMAIQALAPYYAQRADVKAAVDGGLACLSSMQDNEGGFSSSGAKNSESCVQVLTALAAMKIDPTDSRFVKEGNSVIDCMLSYQQEDGSFSHTPNGAGDQMATDQCVYALTAYVRYANNQTSLYDMSDVASQGPTMSEEELRQRILALSETDKLTLEEESEIASLAIELPRHITLEDAANLQKILDEAKAKVDAIRTAAETLDEDIWNQIKPLSITYDDKDAVAELMKRYEDLGEKNQAFLKNAADLLDAAAIMEAMDQGVIPERIFQNLKTTQETFKWERESDLGTYQIEIQGKEVGTSKNMDAQIRLTEGKEGFYLFQDGVLPAVITVTMPMDMEDGTYLLYQMEEKDVWSAVQHVTVKDKMVTFTTVLGGQFAVRKAPEAVLSVKGTAAVTKSSSSSKTRSSSGAASAINSEIAALAKDEGTTIDGNTVKVSREDGVIRQNYFEAIDDTEQIIKREAALDTGSTYAVYFHGEDIEKPMDVNTTIVQETEHEDNIRKLAQNPFILNFKHSGELPGQMLVELEIDRPDGDYLLFYYNEELQQAEYQQKITVTDSKTQLLISHCSVYFIDTRAKTKSLLEEDVAMLEEEETKEAVQNDETEAVPDEAEDGATATDTTDTGVWVPALVLLVAAGAVWVIYMGKRRRPIK